jgi:hypothetical protein
MNHFRRLKTASFLIAFILTFPILVIAGQYQVIRVVDSPSWIVSGSAATERLGGSASGVALSFSQQDARMKRLVNKRKLIKTRFFMILPSFPHQDLGTFLRKKSLNLGLGQK